jgi:hypothetical protein
MDDIEDNVRERNLDKEDGAIANADNWQEEIDLLWQIISNLFS